MTDLPPIPTDPAALEEWFANLSMDNFTALARQMIDAATVFPSAESRNREIELPAPASEPQLLTVVIELSGADPRIWRRLTLPGDLTLDVVHRILQAAMGWSDSHLHRFQPGAEHVPYFTTEVDEEEGDEGTREEGVRLDQVLRLPGDQLTYLYDFGDGWEHRVTLESTASLSPEDRDPRCLGGANACPPEDVGGLYGHHEVAQWLRAGAPADAVPEGFEDAEHAHLWLPAGYDPDAFDAAATTQAMRVWAAGEHVPWHGLPEPLSMLIQGLRSDGWEQASDWLSALGPRRPVVLDEHDVLQAARPWLAVLRAIGPGLKLTAAGYLPPATVFEIARATGVTQWWHGKANRENDVWPVAILREAAQDVGLVRKAKGTLTPTTRARAAAGDPVRLVAVVLDRLPVGKGFEHDAGWFTLLGLAAGVSGADLDAGVARMLNDRGWRVDGTGMITGAQARRGAMNTSSPLELMAGGRESLDGELLVRLARAVILGVARPA